MNAPVTLAELLGRINRATLSAVVSIVATIVVVSSFSLGLLALIVRDHLTTPRRVVP